MSFLYTYSLALIINKFESNSTVMSYEFMCRNGGIWGVEIGGCTRLGLKVMHPSWVAPERQIMVISDPRRDAI